MILVNVTENLTTKSVLFELKGKLSADFCLPFKAQEFLLDALGGEARIVAGTENQQREDATNINGSTVASGDATVTQSRNVLTWYSKMGCVGSENAVRELGLFIDGVLFVVANFKGRYIPYNYAIEVKMVLELSGECC